ncbi:MAG: hypothetical protein IKQ31_03275 [Clostridia bacterium]|nr:hypothetical protein [Clostridia bacterium]
MEKKVKQKYLLIICCGIILLSLCATCGIVWAKLAFTAGATNQSIPPASLSATVYVGASANSNTEQTSSSFSVANNNSIYILPATCGSRCVMRARTTKTNYTFASTWTLQDNDWYYYNSVIQPGATTKILFATNSSGSTISGNNIYVELMQENGVDTDMGFVADWASLTVNTIVQYNDANTIQVYSNLTSSFDVSSTGEYFGAYVLNGSNQIYQLTTLSTGSTTTLNTTSGNAIYAPVTTSDNLVYSGNVYKAGAGQLSNSQNIKLYNNITSSIVFLVGFSPLLYDSSKNLISAGIANLTLSSTRATLTTVPNTYAMIVRPGQCESILSSNAVSVTLSEINSSVAYVRLVMSVTAIDVDSFQSIVDVALDKSESNRTAAEKRFIDAYNALGGGAPVPSTFYVSAFLYWLKKLDETNLTYYDLYTIVSPVNVSN